MSNNLNSVWILLFFLLQTNEACINNIKADIVFSFDEALNQGSCGSFSDTLQAVSDTVSRLNIDSTSGIRVGAMAIHNYETTRKVFDLDDYTSVSSIQSAVNSISHGNLPDTHLAVGLEFGCFQMFGGPDDRNDAPNYLIYIVHGTTNDTLADEVAADCAAAGVTIAIVAIDYYGKAITSIATSASDYLGTGFFCLAGNLARHTYDVTNCQWRCDAGSKLVKGISDTSTYSSATTQNGFTYMIISSVAQFKCCGRIYSWEFYAKESGTLTLQVWKPISGNSYRLVGVNILYIPSNAINTVHTYIVPDNERITVNTGDYFGWHSSGINIIPYQTGDSSDVIMYYDNGDTTLGDTVDFSSATTKSNSEFVIKVTLENDDDNIWFPDSGYTLTLFDHLSTSERIFNWSVGQKDQEFLDLSFYQSTCSASSTFSYTQNEWDTTGYVSLSGSLSHGTSYQLTFTAKDTCTNCNSATLNVNVDNLPPRILSLPSFYELHEDTDLSSNLVLHTLATQDDSGDSVSCSKRGTQPSSSIFGVRNNGGTSTIILKSGSTLDFDTASEYRIKIRCTDGKDNDDRFFKVFLRRNVPPRITNMFIHLDWVAGSYSSGSLIVTPSTTDTDSTSFTYTQSYCDSPPGGGTCPAQMPVTSNGALYTNVSMSSFTGGGFNVRVTVSDGQTQTGPYPVSVRVYDLNDSPVIYNVPLADDITITEGIPPFTWLYTVQFYDINNWNSLTLTTTITPAEGATYFDITRTLNDQDTIKTSSNQINYETLSNYQFTVQFSLNDGVATVTKSLTITVLNENEGLSFELEAYTIAADEGPVDTVIGDPGFVVTHTDSGDTVQYTFDCGTETRYYKMDNNTGVVSYAWNMDVDKGYQRQAVCTVTAWDSGYMTATTRLTITVYDINDNSPRFDKKYYTYWTTSSQAVGTVLGTISITDADITFPHNYVERIWIENQPSDIRYFDRNETTGQFYINKNLSAIGDGNVLEFTIYAEDYGQLKSYANITVILPSETTTTSTTTTDTPFNTMEDSINSLWISCAVVLGMVICILAFYMLCNYTCSPRSSKVENLPQRKKPGRGRDIVFRDSAIC